MTYSDPNQVIGQLSVLLLGDQTLGQIAACAMPELCSILGLCDVDKMPAEGGHTLSITLEVRLFATADQAQVPHNSRPMQMVEVCLLTWPVVQVVQPEIEPEIEIVVPHAPQSDSGTGKLSLLLRAVIAQCLVLVTPHWDWNQAVVYAFVRQHAADDKGNPIGDPVQEQGYWGRLEGQELLSLPTAKQNP